MSARWGGFSLIELLVAMACLLLVAAAALPAFVQGAAAARQRQRSLDALALADAVAGLLRADLQRAGAGLDGAERLRIDGSRTPLVGAAPGGLELVRTLAPPVEVDEVVGAGDAYWVADPGPLQPGRLVAAIGQPGRPRSEPPPAGRIDAVVPGVGGALVRLQWGAAERGLVTAWGAPRALVPVSLRRYRVVDDGDVPTLRRRDDGGRWQPVADGVVAVELTVDSGGSVAVEVVVETAPGVRESAEIRLP